MMSDNSGTEAEIRRLELDALSAQEWAHAGKVEAWVHRYLLSGSGGQSNPEFSAGLKQAPRWWRGPIEVDLADVSPAVGPEPGMEYEVDKAYWDARISKLAASLTDPQSLPPLIIEYRRGELSVRDGNTRVGAMRLLGWTGCWAIIWYNSEADFHEHIPHHMRRG